MAGVNPGGQAANVPQAVGLPDERPPTPEEAEVHRRLVREFRDNGGATLLNFCLNGEERFPHEYQAVQSLVSRFFRYVELGVLVESGPVGMIAKLREVGWEDALGHVRAECTPMAWVRPLIGRDEATTMCFAELQGGDYYRCVDLERMANGSEVPYSALNCFGAPGTMPCTVARVSQNMMHRVNTRSQGRDRALAVVNHPVRPAPNGVEIDGDGNVLLLPGGQKGKGKGKAMVVAPRPAVVVPRKGKGKGKGKGMRLVRLAPRVKAKARAKARAAIGMNRSILNRAMR